MLEHFPDLPFASLDPRAAAVLGTVLGAVAGSFLATLAIRWPAGRSVVHGRSRCDACGHRIPAGDLVPIASFLLLRGRCRACAVPIDRAQPAMEIGCAAIGLVALTLSPDVAGVAGAVFGWWLAALALIDARHFWLPDRLTLPLLALGLLVGAWLQPGLEDRAIGALAGWTSLGAIGWLYRRARGRTGIGGGDPKMLGAIGAWLGWAMLPMVLLVASGLGLGWALGRRWLGQPVTLADRMPLGTLMAPAAFACWVAVAGGLMG